MSFTEGTTIPPKALVPATTLRPDACTCWYTFLKYCTPAVVLELTTGDKRNDAVVANVAVYAKIWARFWLAFPSKRL